MTDERIKKFANILVNYSTKVKKGETVQISGDLLAKDLIEEVYKLVLKRGAYPIVHVNLPGLAYDYYKLASEEQLKHFPKITDYEVKNTQVYIGISADLNTRELTNLDSKKILLRAKVTDSIKDYIANGKPNIRRVSTDFPTNALAQEADMSLQEYENFVFNAINQDWENLGKKMNKIRNLFVNANKVRIIGEDTDLSFNIKGRGKNSVVDAGEENMPGGEVFMAINEKTANGKMKFTYPAIRQGREVTNVELEFKNGKVVKAKASKNENFLKQTLNIDKGARYIGEFGIGCNYRINKFTKNLLYDEKMSKTIHLALGMAYKENKGTNKSVIHWDMVKDLRKGGEIIVDGKVVQKNGKFLI